MNETAIEVVHKTADNIRAAGHAYQHTSLPTWVVVEVDEKLTAIERVERIHRLVEDPAGDVCAADDEPWPCETRTALDASPS